MAMNEILKYMKVHGEQLDRDIAAGTGISIAAVRSQLTELAARHEVVSCTTIRFDKGKRIEGTIYRVSGYIPPASPGRKPKAQ